MDAELMERISKRQESGDTLLNEMEDLMKETSALMEKSEKQNETGFQDGEASEEGEASVIKPGTPMSDLRKLMKVLEQKEADLELAARIGDALFQENTKLRKEASGGETLRAELEAKEEELIAAREQSKSLQRKVETLITHLEQAESANAKLSEELEAAYEEQNRLLTSPTSPPRSPDLSPSSPNLVVSTPPSSPGLRKESPIRSVSTTKVSSNFANQLASLESEEELLETQEELLDSWRKRAIVAEKQLSTQRAEKDEETTSLRKTIEQLERELRRKEGQLEQLHSEVKVSKQELDQENERKRKVHELENSVRSLQKENAALIEDLKEYKILLGERRAQQDHSADSDAESEPHEDLQSLQAELADTTMGSVEGASKDQFNKKALGSTSEASKRQEDEVDPYFFHFHMTAMSVKAHLSIASQQKGGSGLPISSSALDTINAMDTREMYKDVITKAIPPHHWIGYIKDCFATAQIKALLKEKSGTQPDASALQGIQQQRAQAYGPDPTNQSYLHEPFPSRYSTDYTIPMSRPATPTTPSSTSSSGVRGKRGKSSYFSRFLHALTATTSPADSQAQHRLNASENDEVVTV